MASFGIGMTIVEPGGTRTEFRYGNARVATLMPEGLSVRGSAVGSADAKAWLEASVLLNQ